MQPHPMSSMTRHSREVILKQDARKRAQVLLRHPSRLTTHPKPIRKPIRCRGAQLRDAPRYVPSAMHRLALITGTVLRSVAECIWALKRKAPIRRRILSLLPPSGRRGSPTSAEGIQVTPVQSRGSPCLFVCRNFGGTHAFHRSELRNCLRKHRP